MGIAAYNRGSKVISTQIQRDAKFTCAAFEIMDRINALPKFGDCPNKRHPLIKVMCAQYDRGVWWFMDPDNMHEGYSLWYKSLEDLVRSWDVYLTGYDETTKIWTLTAL